MITLIFVSGIALAVPTPADTKIKSQIMTIEAHSVTICSTLIEAAVIVKPIYAIELMPLAQTLNIGDLTPVYFSHQIVNRGNATDNIVITGNNRNANWAYQLILDANGDGIRQSTENTLVTSPLRVLRQTTANIFLKVTPLNFVSFPAGLAVSTNNKPAGFYTGFNDIVYGGLNNRKVTDNVRARLKPITSAVDPLPNALNMSVTKNIVLDTISPEGAVSRNLVYVWINNEQAINKGIFTPAYSGAGSLFVPSSNGYRITIDKLLIYAPGTQVSVTVNSGSIYGAVSTYAYHFQISSTGNYISLQLRALLQGYYELTTDQMMTAPVKIELRTTRNVPAAISYNITLNKRGLSDVIQTADIPKGNYYVYLAHFNHMKVITSSKIYFTTANTTVNISWPSSPNFRAVYLSPAAQHVSQTMRSESNGRLTVRGGDYNNDNTINLVDWSAFDYEWKRGGVIADFDGNGIIDTRDYGIWLSNNQDYVPID